MPNLRRLLPPLDPLVAFEAAARLHGFTAAAKELNVTQAAVSQQIRALEDSLGTPLFVRAHRAVRLTPAGRAYQHTVSLALTHLANATGEIRAAGAGAKLTVAADQSVASLWLMARLPRFRMTRPQVPVRLVASDDEADCLAEGVEVAILHGNGAWPGFESLALFEEEVFPVCSPDYLRPRAGLAAAEELVGEVLLDLEDEHWNWITWRMWLTEIGVDLPAAHRGLQINNYPLVIEAAKNGQGIALGWRYLVDDELSRGTLVRPLYLSVRSGLGYHLIWPREPDRSPDAAAFCDWVIAERDRQAPRADP